MKYIRTKDAIFEVTSKAGNIYCATNQNNEFVLVNGRVVEKEADTIEELCDMCIVWFKDDKYPMFDDVNGINRYKELKQFGGNIRTNVKYDAIYLAIWTDKGLIYVAKINDKGELELL